MSFEDFSYRLMEETDWIKIHVEECVQSHLTEQTFLQNILPFIDKARKDGMDQKQTEVSIAKFALNNRKKEKEVNSTIKCIKYKILHEAKTERLPVKKRRFLPLACTLFGRFFLIKSYEAGYIVFKDKLSRGIGRHKITETLIFVHPNAETHFLEEPLKTNARIIIIDPFRKIRLSHVTFPQIFPEIKKVSKEKAEQLLSKLETLPERKIQDAFRDALREKGANRITERKHDSSLEVADVEDFVLRIGQEQFSFAIIVKGYKSVRGSRVRYEDIAHQLMRAYQRTEPNHVILALAKYPADGVVSDLVRYGETIGNRDLVILVEPVDLTKFLHVKRII